MKLYNTLARNQETLPTPTQQKIITLYTCGPTVYDETHIGHMRKYAMDDILKRALIAMGHEVNHVMNITDVGHLSGDDDSGDDKLEKGALKQGKTVWELAQYYTDQFFVSMDAVNIRRPDTVMKATDHIADMTELIQKLENNGYTYETSQAIYFDTSKFAQYGKLSGQKLDEKKQAVREEVIMDADKKQPADFALWFKRVGRFADHTMHWPSPWGEGFPGWHIECSAMSMKALGPTIDIHTGGIDHIPVHHENEIAQSEAATGKQFVKWWVHHAFLKVDGEKMSKSKENFYTLKDLKKKNIDPFALRYLFLQAHYRKELNFTWESVEAAQNALQKLRRFISDLQQDAKNMGADTKETVEFSNTFMVAIEDDLNTSQALAVVWDVVNSPLSPQSKNDLILSFDQILGLGLADIKKKTVVIPPEIAALAEERILAKQQKDFAKADILRRRIEKKGYVIKDTKQGYSISMK